MLDRQGLSARTIADRLDHARISMTEDVYMGRRVVDQAATAVLEGISPPGHDGDNQPPAVQSVVG
jgi:integrase